MSIRAARHVSWLRSSRWASRAQRQCPPPPKPRDTGCAAFFSTTSSASSGGDPPRDVRVRYAPSPTGFLHLGGLRTALYNILMAKQGGPGSATVLRIEDTDQSRLVPGSARNLLETFSLCGLEFDEGPPLPPAAADDHAAAAAAAAAGGGGDGGARAAEAGAEQGQDEDEDEDEEGKALWGRGDHGPYVQSERLPLYKENAERLIESGAAYRCFCSQRRLEALRRHQKKRGLPSLYDRHCLKLTDDEVAERVERGDPHTVRLRVGFDRDGDSGEGEREGGEDGAEEDTGGREDDANTPGSGRRTGPSETWEDAVKGAVSVPHAVVDDQVLLKSDGFPTYHLASVVDDHAMGITHVVRGDEWLSS